jgi:hypothetical protein
MNASVLTGPLRSRKQARSLSCPRAVDYAPITQSFSMGLFVDRVQRGSHLILEQISVGDAVWVRKRLEVRASAKLLFLKSLDIGRILTYSDYYAAADGHTL